MQVGVLPARYQSSRVPGKPLVPLLGKSMILHTYEQVGGRVGGWATPHLLLWATVSASVPQLCCCCCCCLPQACRAASLDAVVVATDDERIAEVCRAAGALVVMTRPDCANGGWGQRGKEVHEQSGEGWACVSGSFAGRAVLHVSPA